MSCKYCNNKTTIDKEEDRVYVSKYIYNDNQDDSKDLYQRILITDNKLRVEIDEFELNFDGYCDEYSYRIEVNINYCPICGRKLKGDDLK